MIDIDDKVWETAYEWKLERLDVPQDTFEPFLDDFDLEDMDMDTDIVDSDFADHINEFSATDIAEIDGKRTRLVLVRDRGNDVDGLVDRSHAYVTRGGGSLILPLEDEDGHKVPKRYHRQLYLTQHPED